MSSQAVIQLPLVGVEPGISPERVFRWALQFDPESFEWFMMALTRKVAELSDWEPPTQHEGEQETAYRARVEASVMELTGKTLSNVIMSAHGYAGIWGQRIIEKGLTMLPEFLAGDASKGLAAPLREWFEECQVAEAIGRDATGRIVSFLTEVVPATRRFAQIDPFIISLLVDETRGFSFPRKAVAALNAVRIARARNDGVVPEEVCRCLAKHLSEGERNPDAMLDELTALGVAAPGRVRIEWKLPFELYQKVDADGVFHWGCWIPDLDDAQIEFLVNHLEAGPFFERFDLGAESREGWKPYVHIE